MRYLVPVFGVLFALLGGLWLLQGLGIVEIQPVLCVADCEPLQGPSRRWTFIGAFFFVAGIVTTVLWFRRRKRM